MFYSGRKREWNREDPIITIVVRSVGVIVGEAGEMRFPS